MSENLDNRHTLLIRKPSKLQGFLKKSKELETSVDGSESSEALTTYTLSTGVKTRNCIELFRDSLEKKQRIFKIW